MRKSSHRQIKTAVTNFIHCGDEYLFLHRNANKKIDPDKLNGIGGKAEHGENFVQTVIRETYEETGIKINEQMIRLLGVVMLEGGYDDDWLTIFFITEVSSKEIPLGLETEDGKLLWIHEMDIAQYQDRLVDDVRVCFEDFIQRKKLIFMNAEMDTNFKVKKAAKSYLSH